MEMEEEKQSSFFKIVPPSCIELGCLAIPEKFTRDFRDKLGSIVVLKVSTGKEWRLELREDEGKLCFHSGWEDFMQYYSIRVWQFLVFHYLGNSTFEVFIFDTTGSEIEYPCDNMVEPGSSSSCSAFNKRKVEDNEKQGKLFDHQEDDIIELEENEEVHFTNDENSYNMDSNQELDQCVGHKEKQPEFIHDHQPADHILQEGCDIFGSIFRRTNESKAPAIDLENFHDERMSSIRSHCGKRATKALQMKARSNHWSRRRKLGKLTKEKATIAVEAFTSKHPFCKVYMHPSYLVNKYLFFPADFSRKHLQGVKEVTLRVSDGRTWQVRCSSREVQVYLLKEWHAFVLDNHLGKGDVCIFELVDTLKMEMKVSIFRRFHQGSKTSPPPAKLHINNSSVTRKHATSLENERTVLAARSFSSHRPFCSVTMPPSYVCGKFTLSLPNAFVMEHLKDGFKGVTLRGPNGGTWPVYFSVEQPRKVTRGWKAFVLDNHLRVNDVCIFELFDAKNMELKVFISRPT